MKELSSYPTVEIITEREVRETNSASVPLFLSAVLFNDWTLTNYHRLHCEKSLFVLASRQKIPVLRTENPAVDTRTICLLPIEFF
jgi:hypothetical protein